MWTRSAQRRRKNKEKPGMTTCTLIIRPGNWIGNSKKSN